MNYHLNNGSEIDDYEQKPSGADSAGLTEKLEKEDFDPTSSGEAASAKEVEGYLSVLDVARRAWHAELTSPFPANIERLVLTCTFTRTCSTSLVDRVKLSLEAYTGEPWLWWPLKSPRSALEQGKVRLEWLDVSCLKNLSTRGY